MNGMEGGADGRPAGYGRAGLPGLPGMVRAERSHRSSDGHRIKWCMPTGPGATGIHRS